MAFINDLFGIHLIPTLIVNISLYPIYVALTSENLNNLVYVGFVVINIELLEIVIDGFLGTHRVFAPFLGGFYKVLIATFEVFAALVLVSVILFWTRRNVMRIKRFWSAEMKGWPKWDADIILYAEVVLMGLL